MGRYVIGVDLGGTNVTVLLLDSRGGICSVIKDKTSAREGPTVVLGQITSLVLALVDQADLALSQVRGMGIGLPGVVASATGMALFLPNLPGWHDIPVAKYFKESLGLEVYCENDARMAAWGEKLMGAGQGFADLVCLTLGTGIGSGVFLQGKLWRGHLGSAGEIGHLTIEKDGPVCTCGNRGCLEMYASGRGIARRTREALVKNESSLLNQLVGGKIEEVSAATVHEAALAGDQLALCLLQETAEYLGLALANLANILNPEVLVLGGGVTSGMGEMLLSPVRKVVNERAMSLNSQVVIKQAQLGERAGAIGAAHLARLRFLEGQDISALYW